MVHRFYVIHNLLFFIYFYQLKVICRLEASVVDVEKCNCIHRVCTLVIAFLFDTQHQWPFSRNVGPISRNMCSF